MLVTVRGWMQQHSARKRLQNSKLDQLLLRPRWHDEVNSLVLPRFELWVWGVRFGPGRGSGSMAAKKKPRHCRGIFRRGFTRLDVSLVESLAKLRCSGWRPSQSSEPKA